MPCNTWESRPHAHVWPSCCVKKEDFGWRSLPPYWSTSGDLGLFFKIEHMCITVNYYAVHKLQKVIIRGIYVNIPKGFQICWTSFEISHKMTDCELHEKRDRACHTNQALSHCWKQSGSNEYVLNKSGNAFLNFLSAWRKRSLNFGEC